MKKRIITHKWGNNPTHDEYTSTNAFVFGNYGENLTHYMQLVAEAKKDFPALKDDEIFLHRVSESPYMKHFVFIRFSLPANTTHKDYANWSKADFNY